MFYDMSSVWSPSNSEPEGTNSEAIRQGLTQEVKSEDPGLHGETYILLTTVSGKSLSWYRHADDSEIVESCVRCLKMMFGQSSVTPVLGYLVSRWGANPRVAMSYSFVAVGASGEDYDIIAEPAHRLVHFAGEVGALVIVRKYACNPVDYASYL